MMLWYLSLFSLWLSPILCFYTAFLCQSSYFFFLMWAVMGHFQLCCCCLFATMVSSLGLNLKVSDQVKADTVGGEGHCQVHTVWGRGSASSVCTCMIETSLSVPLALIGFVDPGAVDSCKSNKGRCSGAVKLNNLAFCERSMKLSGFVLDDLNFNLRCGDILSLTPETS